MLLVRWANTVFGCTGGTTGSGEVGGARAFTSWKVTIGGAPVPWTDDEAVSSMSSCRAGGEVAALELFSDGVDIFGLRLETIDYLYRIFAALTPFKQNGLLSVVALAVLNNNTCALLPRLYRTKFLSWTASKNGLPHSKLGFQRNNVSLYSSPAVTLSLVRCFRNARARSTSPNPVATRNVLACGTFHLAPKPVVKNCCLLDSCSVLRRMSVET